MASKLGEGYDVQRQYLEESNQKQRNKENKYLDYVASPYT